MLLVAFRTRPVSHWCALPAKDTFFFLDRVLHKKCGVFIIIDEVTPQLMEICEDFSRYAEVKVIEFKTYQKDDREIYYFNPLTGEEVTKPPEREERPEYRKSWEARLAWVNKDTKLLVNELIRRLEEELPRITHRPKYRWHYFYKHEALFTVLLITKRKINIRMSVNPSKFNDRLALTKPYKGWFFRKGEEKGFSISKPDQLNYALELIKQAYDYAKG